MNAETAEHARQWARDLVPFARHVWRRFTGDNCLRVAASLSYTSLLSLVPLLTIGFAMFAAFPGFSGVREKMLGLLLDNMVMQDKDTVAGYFQQFIDAAGGMTAFGTIGLGVTAIMLLSTIESAMNAIFRVDQDRPLLMRVLVFWTLLTVGPMLIGSSFTLAGYITALTKVAGVDAFNGVLGRLTRFVPALMLIVTFSLLYKAMPNRPVRTSHALAGGVVAGLLFAFLRWGFGLYIVYFPSYKAIYGAISTIPIFLVWMYLSWAVVLIGATLTAALGEWRGTGGVAALLRVEGDEGRQGRRLWLAVQIIELLHRASLEGHGKVMGRDLIGATAASDRAVRAMLRLLAKAGFVQRAEGGGWLLARSPETTRLSDLHVALGLPLGLSARGVGDGPEDAWRRRLLERIEGADGLVADRLAIPLRDLFAGDEPRET